MAKPTPRLITALYTTIESIEDGARYQWGHMGMCNCGHLAQALTSRSRAEIHAAALRRAGDWGEQAVEYCPTSGLPIDHIITEMLDAGLTLDDIDYLERLNAPDVLARIPLERRWLSRNSREDLIFYLRQWVAMLEEQLAAEQGVLMRLDDVRDKVIESERAVSKKPTTSSQQKVG